MLINTTSGAQGAFSAESINDGFEALLSHFLIFFTFFHLPSTKFRSQSLSATRSRFGSLAAAKTVPFLHIASYRC